jgi:hypothetical protein
MHYRSSRPFLIGLLLVAAAVIAAPLFATTGDGACSVPSPADTDPPSSWDCFQPTTWDLRVPLVVAASGAVLMLVSVVRRHARFSPQSPTRD